MFFSNQAALSYNDKLINSNSVTGEVISTLRLSKNASASSYVPNQQLQYTITIENISSTSYVGLSLSDNLGVYEFMGFSRFPFAYVEQSAALMYYSSDGVSEGTVAVTEGQDGLVFTFDSPAGTIALLQYTVQATVFAPRSPGSTIINTAVLNGNAPQLPLTVSFTLPVAEQVDLEISKYSKTNAVIGQPFSFDFIITNYGNAPISDIDYVVLSDLLDPPLADIKVYADGVLWTEGTQFVYNESFYFFQTLPGAISLSAAIFEQDDFGRWNALPASLQITVSGIVSSVPASQALMEILPAYTDGREVYLNATRLQNDLYTLSATGAVSPAFFITSTPDSGISLTSDSDEHFALSNGVLSINTDGLVGTITAIIRVEYGDGFDLQINYIS